MFKRSLWITLSLSLRLGIGLSLSLSIASLWGTLPSRAAEEAREKTQTLSLTLQEAVLKALENNQGLKLQRYDTPLAALSLAEQQAIFDANIVAQAQTGAENAKRLLGASTEFLDIFSSTQDLSVGVEKNFATGTQMSLSLSTNATNRSLANGVSNQQVSRLGLSFTQALLQGRDPSVNEALIQQAELQTELVGHNLRGFAEALVAETETAFWDYLSAQQQYRLSQLALSTTQEALENTRERIAVGRLAGIESITLEAELALRQQALITAKGTLRERELELLRLMNPQAPHTHWSDYQLALKEPVGVPPIALDPLETHIDLALQQRPELKEARVLARQRKLEVVRTRDGLLPVLDVFLTLGKTGYADSFVGSVANLTGNGFDYNTGFRFAYPLGARAAEALYQRAQISEAQQNEALKNLEQQIELDLRRAYLRLRLARESISATQTTRQFQQTRFEAEQERYRVGRTNAYQVVLSQRELLEAQVREAESLIAYLKALTQFYRFEGTLLQRHGVQFKEGVFQ